MCGLECVHVVQETGASQGCCECSSESHYNIQYNKMRYVFPRYLILQGLVDHAYISQSLMGSSSRIHIKVLPHKTELAIHVHIKKI